MTTLRTTVGLPGSGKTTAATQWVAFDPCTRARVSRDDLRLMMHGGYLGTRDQEEQITSIRDAGIIKLLRSGISVVADETNLRWGHIAHLQQIARRIQVQFEIVSYLDIHIETCVSRDMARQQPVGRETIYSMWIGSLRNQITTWKTTINARLIRWDYQHPDEMIDAAIGDPLSSKNATITSMALDLTKDKLATFAPRIADAS